MQHSAKYIIHADVRTSGVVERSDVVGAIFGQTEGLLGDDLDLRDLQDASKVGRIDVSIESEGGRSFGTIRIASGLDRVETAVLAASLESLDRVGPCRANCSIAKIEDARAAKRRQIVDRATQLLAEFEEETLTSERLVDEVRKRVEESDIVVFRGVPAGPRVEDSDAIIVVEGRADVRTLLSYGIKNAIAVEGTDIPDDVARLTTERTTTALLDGDRGGDLILRELVQVGDVDYVAFAPRGKSIEDLDRASIISALRKKLPYEQIEETSTPREAFAPTDGGTVSSVPTDSTGTDPSERDSGDDKINPSPSQAGVQNSTTGEPETTSGGDGPATEPRPQATDESEQSSETKAAQQPTLADHVTDVISAETETARFLDEDANSLGDCPTSAVLETLTEMDPVPQTIIIDGTVGQKVLDVAAQQGVDRIIAAGTGEFVKQPTSVRIHTADEIQLE